jgi:hypothetical protein
MSLFQDPLYVKPEKKTLTKSEAAIALRTAWKSISGSFPSNESLAILWAKTKQETGNFRLQFINFNFGNQKDKNDNKPFTMFKCGEEITLKQAQQLVLKTPDLVKIVSTYKKKGEDYASVIILPGHPWSKFKSFTSVEEGAEEYIKFIAFKDRYKKAWQKCVEGDAVGFSHELSVAGYYTANEKKYTEGVLKGVKEFFDNIDELLEKSPQTLKSEELLNVDLTNVPDVEPTIVIDNGVLINVPETSIWPHEDPSIQIPLRTEITVLPADPPKDKKIGFTVLEKTGIGVMNKKLINKSNNNFVFYVFTGVIVVITYLLTTCS